MSATVNITVQAQNLWKQILKAESYPHNCRLFEEFLAFEVKVMHFSWSKPHATRPGIKEYIS